jgi:hypothetical protein
LHEIEYEIVMKQLPSAERFKAFATTFRRYMSVAALVAAALPIPVTAWQLIPIFERQSGLLQVYTPLFCFLIFSFVFYSRHWIGRATYKGYVAEVGRTAEGTVPRRLFQPYGLAVLPLLFIVATVVCVILYHQTLNLALEDLEYYASPQGAAETNKLLSSAYVFDERDVERVFLEDTLLFEIPYGVRLIMLYILIFACAEMAFVLMYLREYLQDILKLSDVELILGTTKGD